MRGESIEERAINLAHYIPETKSIEFWNVKASRFVAFHRKKYIALCVNC